MATTKIDVRNGMFVSNHNGEVTKSREVDINGYHGSVLDNGTIHFERVSGDRGVSGDIFPDGRFRFDNRGSIKRGHVTLDENGKVNGTFGLHTSTGSKYMYFRDAEFQDFLDTRGITAVSRKEPNGIFGGLVADSARGTAEFYIEETDGKVEKLEHEDFRPESRRDENYLHGYDSYRISDATYVVVHSSADYMDKHNSSTILYTMEKDVTKLNIPQKDFSKLHHERERYLNGEIDYGENIPPYVLEDRECAEYYVGSRTEISKETADFLLDRTCKQIRDTHGSWVPDPNDRLTIEIFNKTKDLQDLNSTFAGKTFKKVLASALEERPALYKELSDSLKEQLTKETEKDMFRTNIRTDTNASMTKQEALNAFGDGKAEIDKSSISLTS